MPLAAAYFDVYFVSIGVLKMNELPPAVRTYTLLASISSALDPLEAAMVAV